MKDEFITYFIIGFYMKYFTDESSLSVAIYLAKAYWILHKSV